MDFCKQQMIKVGVRVRERVISDQGFESKLKLKMQSWDSLTGLSGGCVTQLTVQASGSLVLVLLQILEHFL